MCTFIAKICIIKKLRGKDALEFRTMEETIWVVISAALCYAERGSKVSALSTIHLLRLPACFMKWWKRRSSRTNIAYCSLLSSMTIMRDWSIIRMGISCLLWGSLNINNNCCWKNNCKSCKNILYILSFSTFTF